MADLYLLGVVNSSYGWLEVRFEDFYLYPLLDVMDTFTDGSYDTEEDYTYTYKMITELLAENVDDVVEHLW